MRGPESRSTGRRRAWTVAGAIAAALVGAAAGAATAPGADQPAAGASGPAAPSGATAPAAAEGPVRIEVSIDRPAITVGDPITVTARLTYPSGTRITAFEPERAFEARELLGAQTAPPVPVEGSRVLEVRTLWVTSFKTGAQAIPAFDVASVDASGKEGKTASRPVPFEVRSVLTSADPAPADIKSPFAMPVRALWPWLMAAALAAAGLLAWLWWRRRRRGAGAPVPAPAAPPRPPHEIAYAELERLLSAGLLEAGRVKEFYIELAEIVRRYVASRFGVDTFERTSWEILEALRAARLSIKVTTALSEFFSACDLVKFAKYVPDAGETRAAVERAYRLVDETRRSEPSPEAAVPAAVAGGGAAR
jgi:hypothetical protein